MKKILILLLASFSMCANSAYINSINVLKNSEVGVLVEISGYLADPSYFISGTNLTLSANTYTLDIFSNTNNDGAPQVLFPFQVSEDLGFLLPGNYSFVANGYIGNRLTSTLTSSFNVSNVPIPSAIWFFVSAVGGLIFAKRRFFEGP